MKKLLLAALFALPVLFAAAQAKPEWKEMKDFHTVMSQTFHPAEEGKLDPIKNRIGEMIDLAKAWQKSTPPAEFNKPEIKENLNKLMKGAKALNKQIKSGADDAAITKQLTALHDVYHDIVGLCKDEGKH